MNRHALLALVLRGKKLAAVLVALLVVLSAYRAEAQRAASPRSASAPAKAKAKNGSTVRTWRANGTDFRHETLRMNGNIVHWERGSTGKNGVTTVRGKTWGSSYKGEERRQNGNRLRRVTVNGSDGTTREVLKVTDKKGTTRTTISGLPGGVTRRITTWRMNNTQMTDTRDYSADGKLVERRRFGQKAR